MLSHLSRGRDHITSGQHGNHPGDLQDNKKQKVLRPGLSLPLTIQQESGHSPKITHEAILFFPKGQPLDIWSQRSLTFHSRSHAHLVWEWKHTDAFFASASPRCLLDNSLIKPLEDLFFASASRLPQDRQIWLWREEVVESIVWVNQKEVCLKEDLCPLWSPHFLSSPCVNIFVADDCPNVINKLLIVELSDENKQVHH